MFSFVYNAKHRQCCAIRFLKIEYYNVKLLESSNKLNLQLYIVTLYVDIFTDADYSQQPSVVTLPAATTNVSITVSTKGDGVIEAIKSVLFLLPINGNTVKAKVKSLNILRCSVLWALKI